MITDTAKRILGYIGTNKQAKAVDLVHVLGITNAAVHRQLNKLLQNGEIAKRGKPPVVFYILKEKEKPISLSLSDEINNYLEKEYVYVSPMGEFLTGGVGFTRWVSSIHQEKYLFSLAQEYIKIRKHAKKLFTPYGWIDATKAKEQATFSQSAVDKLLYRDFYSLEKFGKTKLGQMVLYAKISQNISIIEQITQQISPIIHSLLQRYAIDAVGFIPPSVKRKIQLMTELKKRLHLPFPEIALVKAYAGDVIVSQKSLSKLEERIVNAQNTIFIDMQKSVQTPKNVLLIDDAVGSGATVHETAKKIQELLHPTGYIIAFAIVGSIKGFEVIREI